MPAKRSVTKKHVHYHRDGTIWAKGRTLDGVPTGYWEWFRKDGTRMRSGHFEKGRQVGIWTTYDRQGRVYKETMMKEKPAGTRRSASPIDAYLASLPDDKRRALERLRRTIRAAIPKAEECLSYQVPAYRLDGKVVVGFGAAAKHCTFFPMSGTTVGALKADLKGYETSKGAIRFDPAAPLPASLVRKVVRTRLEENAAGREGRSGRPVRPR